MANGCDYWMVYLPSRCPDSFLLFVRDSQDRTSLRDFSTGKPRRLPQSITMQQMASQTDEGSTRFRVTEAQIRHKDDVRHWQNLIARYNASLNGTASKMAAPPLLKHSPSRPEPQSRRHLGRAARGSQRQLQDYINLYESKLNAALVSILPPPLRDSTITWSSPRAEDDYREYQDYGFLEAVKLGSFAKELRCFWPPGGPCWDALGILRTGSATSLPFAILVEAKSHIPELRSIGCQASPLSFAQIRRALDETKNWCGASPDSDWTGPLYQYANRIAHLYFIREKLNRPCLLVNIHFVDDPYRPTSAEEWRTVLESVRGELGLTRPVPGLHELFLPATETFSVLPPDPADAAVAVPSPYGPQTPEAPDSPIHHLTFGAWRDEWNDLATFDGRFLHDDNRRIEKLKKLWQLPIPGEWKRSIDPQLLGDRYRRGDRHMPHPGEHAIEHRILVDEFARVRCFGMEVLDGLNAFPLSCDFSTGGRRGNVEADMLLLARAGEQFRFFLCEVKHRANDPWFAAVEALRQIKLFLENAAARLTMVRRGSLPAELVDAPATGVVLAPPEYYSATGKKQHALSPALNLIESFRDAYGVDLRFAVWDESSCNIRELA